MYIGLWRIDNSPEGSVNIADWEAWSKSLDNLPPDAINAVKRCKAKAERRIAMLKKLIDEESKERDTLWEIKNGNSPIIAVAIHNGHFMSPNFFYGSNIIFSFFSTLSN